MKTKIVKILILMLFVLLLNMCVSNNVFASEASISASNCNVGENFTVTVNIPEDAVAYQFDLKVTYSDGSTYTTSPRGFGHNEDFTEQHWAGNYTTSISGKVAGNATVVINNIILAGINGNQLNSLTTQSTAITISDPNPQPVNDTPSTEEPAPAPAPVVTNLEFTAKNETMYTSRRVNIRQNYGTSSSIIQTLAVGTELTRTGVSQGTADGYSWSRVNYNGVTGYVITSALVYEKPIEPEPEPQEEPTEEPQNEPQEEPEQNPDELAELSENLGTIPEVGVNIMPFIFLGSVVSCITMMVEVKRKISK